MPASPNAGGISTAADPPSGLNALPSSSSDASNLPGPQLFKTVLTVSSPTPSRSVNGDRSGASEMTAPTSRSRLAQPSSRRPIPAAKLSSTVLWHSAHVIPTERRVPRSTRPRTPTTAFNSSSASVVAGSPRSTSPRRSARLSRCGSAATSTFSPTASAVAGLTPVPTPPLRVPAIASFNRSRPVQNDSSPNVS